MFGIGTAELIVVAIVGLGLPAAAGVVIWLAVRLARPAHLPPCPQCGGPVAPGANFCSHCGRRLTA